MACLEAVNQCLSLEWEPMIVVFNEHFFISIEIWISFKHKDVVRIIRITHRRNAFFWTGA
jgi:hypothetical protein